MEAAMYPKWIAKVTRLACADCRYCTSFHDIVAIGVSRPSKQEAYIGPLAMLILICPGCGRQMQVTLREPIESVILAMRELVRLADETGRNTPPPFNSGKPKTDSANPTAMKAVDGTGPLRPSRRANQPDAPPTQQEIQAFLRRLRTTSFKRGTKGFTDWMKDLGADSGAADDGGGEQK
jgi:hypothetical protein